MSANEVAIVDSDRFDSLPALLIPLGGAERASVRYGALVQLVSALTGITLEDLVAQLVARLHDTVDFDLLDIVIRNDTHDSVQQSVMRQCSPRGTNVSTDEQRSRWVSEYQQPLRVGDSDEAAGECSRTQADGREFCRSFCGVPLKVGLRPVGALCVATRVARAYCDADEKFLTVVADRVASVIDELVSRGQLDSKRGRANATKLAKGYVSIGEPLPDDILCEGMAGRSAAIRDVVAQLQTVAPTESTVLICGETGTGKELIARALHHLSSRRTHAFVKCNCAAIPTGLLESELFGHEKGAFTGAVALRIGRFELAHRGTMFLDEIGEAPLELQPKLLRVLQEREFERLGNSRTQQTDARLVAATNVNLSEMVDAKRFRADLFYRLNVFPILIPPLRERPEDIPLLVTHFVHDCARRMHRSIKLIASDAMDALVRHSWPGNIRELQNLIERAVILSPGELLQVPISEIDRATKARDAQQTLQEAERAHILAMLKKTRWIVSGPGGAANRLGMKRSTLQFRMKKLGIERPVESDEGSHLM